MRTHELKIKKMYYDRIMTGQKDFEIRFNDRDYQVGDTLSLMPVSEDKIIIKCRPIIAKIKYIHSGLGMAKDFVVLGLDFEVKE